MARPQRKIPWLKWRDGIAYAYWYDPKSRQTKRFSLGTDEAGEAATRFAAFLVQGGAASQVVTSEALTVDAALDQYWEEHVALNCADPRRQEDAIRNLKKFFVDTPLASIDIPMSRRYAEARRTGRIGTPSRRRRGDIAGTDSTIRKELSTLIAASNHAKRWKRITVMPSIELTPATVLGIDDEAPYFTKAEVGMLTDMAEGEMRYFIELAYQTGARRESITSLTREQIRWDAKRIVLKPAGRVATKKRQPIVPILPDMEPALRALWRSSEGRTKLFKQVEFYKPFRRLCEGLGFGDRSNPHILRHSRATHLLQDGVPLYSVARLLGDTVGTIERVYGHHSHEHLAGELGGK